jgi:hypothetical protein
MDIKNLDKLGIYDLRNYARGIGVKSPTSKRKSKIISEIEEILKGEKQAQKSSRGRRPKHIEVKIDNNFPKREEIEIIYNKILWLVKEINEQMDKLKNLLLFSIN